MNSLLSRFPRLRAAATKLGSLMLLFQRAPLIKMLFPEARVLAGAGLGELTKWTVASVAGLSAYAYDSIAGATTISQVLPTAGQPVVNTAVGSNLTFVYQVTGSPFLNQAGSWITTPLPPGLVHTPLAVSPLTSDSITGTPTQAGSTSVTVTVRDRDNPGTYHPSQAFTIVVGPAIITTQPASVAINSGQSTTLSVTAAVGNGSTLSYIWYQGASGDETHPIAPAATAATFTTPSLTAATSYWVKVTRKVGTANVIARSTAASVTINAAVTPPAITTSPASVTIDSGATTTLTVETSGTAPTFQWYEGATGITTAPVTGATSATFDTPALTTTTSYWVRATNTAGTADSAAAVVTVTQPDPVAAWKASVFSVEQLADPLISGDAADPDGDGVPNSAEYIFGTPPLANDPAPLALATAPADQIALSFTAKLATGPGYTGKTRHYALQTRTDLSTGDWVSVAGFEDITGNDQVVTFSAPRTEVHSFYRLSVSLTP